MVAASVCTSSLAVAAAAPAKGFGSKQASPALLKLASKSVGAKRALNLVCKARNTEAAGPVEAAVKACRNLEVPAVVRPALVGALANIVMAGPANAGNLFDFNATLPIICGQFLILMVLLDKVVFDPVGNVLDERDSEIRKRLNNSSGNEEELAAIKAQMEQLTREFNEKTKADRETKRAEQDQKWSKKLGDKKAELEVQLAAQMKTLAESEEETAKAMEPQIELIAKSIYDKIIDKAAMEVTDAPKSKPVISNA